MTDPEQLRGLLADLLEVESDPIGGGLCNNRYRNPDGPAAHAAITRLLDEHEALKARVAELEIALIAKAFPPKPKCGEQDKLDAVMKDYARTMREEVIPKIDADLKEQGRLAHYLRLGIKPPTLSKDQADG